MGQFGLLTSACFKQTGLDCLRIVPTYTLRLHVPHRVAWHWQTVAARATCVSVLEKEPR